MLSPQGMSVKIVSPLAETPPKPSRSLSFWGWHGLSMGNGRQGHPGHTSCPLGQSLAKKGEREADREGSHLSPPPQALIETINQTQKYYARPGARERWLVAMATPEPASPWLVGGGDH